MKRFFIITISLLLISNVVTITLLYNKNIEYITYENDTKDKISGLIQDKNKFNQEIIAQNQQIEDLQKLNDTISDELDTVTIKADKYFDYIYNTSSEFFFFRRCAAIVTSAAGEKYHHFDCYHWKGSNFYIYNIENAEHKGYTACADCWESGLLLPQILG